MEFAKGKSDCATSFRQASGTSDVESNGLAT